MATIYGIKRGGKYRKYVKLRNQVKNMIRKAKAVMEKDIAKDVKKNPKRFWKYANSKRKTKSGISELKYKLGNEVITTKGDKDKAEVLAEFYSSVFPIEQKEGIPILNHKDITFKCEDIKIKEKEVLDLLLNVNPNKSPGPDGIHPKALKELAEILANP